MFTYVTPTFTTEAHPASCYLSTAALNDFYSELMPYTVLANSYHRLYRLRTRYGVYIIYALIGLISTARINPKATPINDNSYRTC